ncbi:MAG: phosphate ABC transporter substrate-binding protein [Rhodoferax sp.]|nr:phosphate ABC transporter substrate-binding protein [Rhodoferax sp.]
MTDPSTPLQRRAALALLASMVAPAHANGVALNFWPFDRRTSRRPLLIAGANAMYEVNQALAQAFAKTHPNVDVVVESGGSLSALIALKRGSVDVAAMNRELKASEEENGLKSFLVARNGVGIVVSPHVGLDSLHAQQVRALLSGQVGNWSQVGGVNAAVQVVSRTRGSTARQFVEEVILEGGDIAPNALEVDSARKLTQEVANSTHAIGYISLKDKQLAVPVRYLAVDGVEASRETLLSARYPFTQSLHLLTLRDPHSTASLFLDFVRSAAGQAVVDASGLVGTY